MAHLKLLVNPKDELAWNRVLMIIEGIGPKTAEKLAGEILGKGSFKEIREHLLKCGEGRRFSEGLVKLESLLTMTLDEVLDVGEKFGAVIGYYTPLLRQRHDDWHLRLNDLDALRQIAMRADGGRPAAARESGRRAAVVRRGAREPRGGAREGGAEGRGAVARAHRGTARARPARGARERRGAPGPRRRTVR